MKKPNLPLAFSLVLAALPIQLFGAANTWLNSSSDFLWNATSANWTSPTTWTDGDDAIFGPAGAGTVLLGSSVAAQNITINASGYTIRAVAGGNTLTLAGAAPTINASANTTNATSIVGSAGLTIQGSATLTLQGDLTSPTEGNRYTGGTFVKGGTVVLAVTNAGSGGTSYALDSIEALDAGATVKFFNSLDGTGTNNVRVPNGQIPVGGASVLTHNLNLTGGTFDLAGDDNQNQLPMPSGNGTIVNSSPYARAVLKFTGYGDTRTFSGQIIDGGVVTNSVVAGKLAYRTEVDFQTGSGTLVLAGSNSFTGFLRLGPGGTTVQLSGAGTLGYPSSQNCPPRQIIQNNGIIDLNGTSQKTGFYYASTAAQIINSAVGTLSTLTLCYNCTNLIAPSSSGIICSIQDDPATSGLIGITKEGTALQNLNGANNTYHGDTVVNNGTLRLDQPGSVSPNSRYRLNTSQGTLQLNYSGDAMVRGLYINGIPQPPGTYGSSTAPITGTGTITVPVPNTWLNTSTDSLWNTSSANWTSPTVWQNGASANFGTTGAGTVSVTEPVVVQDVTFSAPGYTIVGSGGSPLTLDGGPSTITANAGTSNGLALSITGSGGLTFKGTGTTILLGDGLAADANHYTGGTYVRSGTLILQAAGATSSGTAYAVDSIEALDGGATLVIPGTWNGSSATSVRDQIAATKPGSRLNMTGGTLDLHNDQKNQRIPIPEGTGLIINSGPNVQSGLQVIVDGQDHTFAGVIADGNNGVLSTNNNLNNGPGYQIGIINMAGSKNGGGGVWTLTGSNTYSGSTRIDNTGSIRLAGNGTIGFPTPNGLTGPLRIYGDGNPARGNLDLNGRNQTIALMQDGNANGRIFNSAPGTVSTLTIGYGNEQANRSCSFQLIDNQGTGGIFALKKIITAPYLVPPAYTVLATNCAQELKGVCTYSGDTTVSGGSLILSSLTAVSSNSAYRLSTSNLALLKLNYAGTANVRQLWINGVQQPNGVYGAGTPGIDSTSTGTITVTGYAPLTLSASRSGNSISFSWQGVYKLQTATNNVIGPWFDYPGGGTSPVTVPLDPNQGSVFFRLSTY